MLQTIVLEFLGKESYSVDIELFEEDQKQSMTGPARISFLETAVLGMIPVRIVDPMAILEVQFIQMELQANPVIQVIQAMQIQMVQVHSVM